MKIYLDLLPEDRKIELQRSRRFYRALGQEFLFLLPLLFLIVILGTVNFILDIQKNSLILQASVGQGGGKYQELDMYENAFKESNDLTGTLLKMEKEHLNWAEAIVRLNGLVPDGVRVTDFGTKNYSIIIAGNALTRDKLLEFKQNLEENECVSNVNVPLSNMMQRNNVDFQLDFIFKEACLKKQQ